MVIPCQEGVSCSVKGHMEETRSLRLLNSADHGHQQPDKDEQHIFKTHFLM